MGEKSQKSLDLRAEKWLPIRGFEGLYEVSDFGNVRSLTRLDARGHARSGQAIKGTLSVGYRSVFLNFGRKRRVVKIHRLVAEHFCTGQSDLFCHVNHIDHDRLNNSASNLEWCTPRQNSLAAKHAGRIPNGAARWNAMLTESDVMDIRQCKRAGIRLCNIARILSLPRSRVAHVFRGYSWSGFNG